MFNKLIQKLNHYDQVSISALPPQVRPVDGHLRLPSGAS